MIKYKIIYVIINSGFMTYPVLKKRKQNLHTCVQDVQITCTTTV
jgi:hypothetical protein